MLSRGDGAMSSDPLGFVRSARGKTSLSDLEEPVIRQATIRLLEKVGKGEDFHGRRCRQCWTLKCNPIAMQ